MIWEIHWSFHLGCLLPSFVFSHSLACLSVVATWFDSWSSCLHTWQQSSPFETNQTQCQCWTWSKVRCQMRNLDGLDMLTCSGHSWQHSLHIDMFTCSLCQLSHLCHHAYYSWWFSILLGIRVIILSHSQTLPFFEKVKDELCPNWWWHIELILHEELQHLLIVKSILLFDLLVVVFELVHALHEH